MKCPKRQKIALGHIPLKILGMTIQFGFASRRRVMAKLVLW
nr:MAG TPA: hypothetical protein [Caudoviricetes sp.]